MDRTSEPTTVAATTAAPRLHVGVATEADGTVDVERLATGDGRR